MQCRQFCGVSAEIKEEILFPKIVMDASWDFYLPNVSLSPVFCIQYNNLSIGNFVFVPIVFRQTN